MASRERSSSPGEGAGWLGRGQDSGEGDHRQSVIAADVQRIRQRTHQKVEQVGVMRLKFRAAACRSMDCRGMMPIGSQPAALPLLSSFILGFTSDQTHRLRRHRACSSAVWLYHKSSWDVQALLHSWLICLDSPVHPCWMHWQVQREKKELEQQARALREEMVQLRQQVDKQQATSNAVDKLSRQVQPSSPFADHATTSAAVGGPPDHTAHLSLEGISSPFAQPSLQLNTAADGQPVRSNSPPLTASAGMPQFLPITGPSFDASPVSFSQFCGMLHCLYVPHSGARIEHLKQEATYQSVPAPCLQPSCHSWLDVFIIDSLQ